MAQMQIRVPLIKGTQLHEPKSFIPRQILKYRPVSLAGYSITCRYKLEFSRRISYVISCFVRQQSAFIGANSSDRRRTDLRATMCHQSFGISIRFCRILYLFNSKNGVLIHKKQFANKICLSTISSHSLSAVFFRLHSLHKTVCGRIAYVVKIKCLVRVYVCVPAGCVRGVVNFQTSTYK